MGKLKILLFVLLFLQPLIFPDVAISQTRYSLKKGVGMAMLPTDCAAGNAGRLCRQNYMNKLKDLGITWLYNWGTPPVKYTWWDNSVEYVPMVWGAGSGENRSYTDIDLEYIRSFANHYKGSYWLIWNEPNYWRQSDISPDLAAAIYKPLRDEIKSIDPAAKFIVGGVAWMNLDWLTEFRDEYKKIHNVYPPVNGWAIHHYEDKEYSHVTWRNTINTAKKWLTDNHQESKEIWLTEFGSLASNGIGIEILKDQIEWMEAPEQSWITRYAWFFAGVAGTAGQMKGELFQGSLLDSTFGLNYMGQEYARHPVNSTITPIVTPTVIPTITPTVTPTVTPIITLTVTPTVTPTISVSRGWNRLVLTSSHSSTSFPLCNISEYNNAFWQSFVLGSLQNKTYYLNCRF